MIENSGYSIKNSIRYYLNVIGWYSFGFFGKILATLISGLLLILISPVIIAAIILFLVAVCITFILAACIFIIALPITLLASIFKVEG